MPAPAHLSRLRLTVLFLAVLVPLVLTRPAAGTTEASPHHLTISVTGDDGPLSWATVTLLRPVDGGYAVWQRTTERVVSFDLTVPDGTYRVLVQGPADPVDDQQRHTPVFYGGAAVVEEAQDVVVAGADVDLGTVELASRRAITGTVRDTAGRPVREVHVGAHDPARPYDAEGDVVRGTTREDGSFRLYVDPGSWRIRFADHWERGFLDSWYHDARTFQDATPVAVTRSDDVGLGDVRVLRASTVVGRVTTSSGGHPEGARVLAVDEAGVVRSWGWVHDEDGAFIVELPSGTYRFYAEAPGFATAYHGGSSIETAKPVVLDDEQRRTGLDFRLVQGSSPPTGTDLAGRVSGVDGRPLVGVMAMAWDPQDGEGPYDYAETDATGHYYFTHLDHGEAREGGDDWTISFHDAHGDLSRPAIQETWYGGRTAAEAVPVHVPAAGFAAADVTATLYAGVHGTLDGVSDMPGHAEVAVFDEDGELVEREVTDDGRFELRHLEPGRSYRFRFSGTEDEGAHPWLPVWWAAGNSFATATPVATTAGSYDRLSIAMRDRVTALRPPRISVSARRLSVHPGVWVPASAQYTYRWIDQRGTALGTGRTYVPRQTDVGSEIRAEVTARDPLGTATASSLPVEVSRAPRYASTTEVAGRFVAARGGLPSRIELLVRVAARGTTPTGTVSVHEDGRRVATRLRLVRGKVESVIRRPAPGRHRFVVRYSGSRSVAPSTRTVVVTAGPRAG